MIPLSQHGCWQCNRIYANNSHCNPLMTQQLTHYQYHHYCYDHIEKHHQKLLQTDRVQKVKIPHIPSLRALGQRLSRSLGIRLVASCRYILSGPPLPCQPQSIHPLTSTKLYCLVTEACVCVCKQLAQS